MTRRLLLRLLMTASAAGLLAACANFPQPVLATPASLPGKAVVIVSVTHEPRAGKADGRVILDGRTPGYTQLRSAASVVEPSIRNDFSDRVGEVYVLELTPGHHRFNNWWLQVDSRVAKPAPDGLPLEFDVTAGEVVYLGDLHIAVAIEKTRWFNNDYATAAEVVVQDRSAVDIPIAERANPWLAGKVRPALLPLGPWIDKPAGAR